MIHDGRKVHPSQNEVMGHPDIHIQNITLIKILQLASDVTAQKAEIPHVVRRRSCGLKSRWIDFITVSVLSTVDRHSLGRCRGGWPAVIWFPSFCMNSVRSKPHSLKRLSTGQLQAKLFNSYNRHKNDSKINESKYQISWRTVKKKQPPIIVSIHKGCKRISSKIKRVRNVILMPRRKQQSRRQGKNFARPQNWNHFLALFSFHHEVEFCTFRRLLNDERRASDLWDRVFIVSARRPKSSHFWLWIDDCRSRNWYSSPRFVSRDWMRSWSTATSSSFSSSWFNNKLL